MLLYVWSIWCHMRHRNSHQSGCSVSPLPRVGTNAAVPPQKENNTVVWLYVIVGYIPKYISVATPEIKWWREETGGQENRKGWRNGKEEQHRRREERRNRTADSNVRPVAALPAARHGNAQTEGELQAVQRAGAAPEVWRSLHAQNWWETVLCGCSHPWSRGWRGRVGGGGPRDGRQLRVNQMLPINNGEDKGGRKLRKKESNVESDNRGHVVNS